MQFQIINNGRGLEITAETPNEVRETMEHFKLDPFEHVCALQLGKLTHVASSWKRDNAAWFAVENTVPVDFLRPYMDRLAHIVGYVGDVPTIEPAPRYANDWLLCHTHIVDGARIDAQGYTAWGYICAGDWNGKTAEERARINFAEYLRDNLGDRKQEREFVEVGNGGLLKHNPNYLRRHAPHPAASNALIFGALLQWWIDAQATPAQRDVIARALACHQSVCKADTLGAWMLRSYENGWRTAWDGPDSFVTFEAFKGLQ